MRTFSPSQYEAYMASEAWARRKAWWRSVTPRRRRRCRACGGRRYDLHHRTYARGGCERRRDLVPLCDRHHRQLHDLQRRLGWSVERASRRFLWGARARTAVRLLFATPPGWAVVGVSLLLVLR